MKPTILALYLPQYYPFKENDEWWGKGFTEWTNVGKAKPLFRGHYQPKVPADLGYYDLRVPEAREQQAELAREAGVTGFLYWHYWFGDGKRLMSQVFQEVLDSGKPDFPFALAWANHSWEKKDWAGGRQHDVMLQPQTYSLDDARKHAEFLIKAFKDPRYVKIDGCPFFYIFLPEAVPTDYLALLRRMTQEAGFKDLFLVANAWGKKPYSFYEQMGYSARIENNILDLLQDRYASMPKVKEFLLRTMRRIKQHVTGMPRGAMNYADFVDDVIKPVCRDEHIIPEIFPNWDHSPRSGRNATAIYYNAQPKYFYRMARHALDAVKGKPEGKQIIVLKSWNEWGEGNYMEPDLKYGKGYIEALHNAIEDSK